MRNEDIEAQRAALLEELRRRMAELRPHNIEQTMRLAGVLRSTTPDPVIGEELRGYLRVLGQRWREWRRAGLLKP